MANIQALIQSVDPKLWPFCIALLVGFFYWAWKKVHPASFEKIPPRLKALPGAVVAAVVSGATVPDLQSFILDVVIGALTAGGGHEFLERLRKGSKEERVIAAKGITKETTTQ